MSRAFPNRNLAKLSVTMTELQRKCWAEAVIKYPPVNGMYTGISFAEAELRAKAVTRAAAQVGCWTHLPAHLVLIHHEMLRRSNSL